MNNYAFITLITHNDYMIPAILLMYGFKSTNSKYPLYIMITKDVSEQNRDILLGLGYKFIEIEEYIPKNYLDIFLSSKRTKDSDRHGTVLNKGGWVHTFNKIKAWQQIQFDKVCFLDLDLFILRNIDEVFNYDEFTCTWRDNGMVSSQMFIAKPNIAIYENLCHFADTFKIPYHWYNQDNVLYTDEDIFTAFFKVKKYFPRTFDYQSVDMNINYNSNLLYDIPNIRVVHFTTREKPWIEGLEHTEHISSQYEYAYEFYWRLCIDKINKAIEDLELKGFIINEKV